MLSSEEENMMDMGMFESGKQQRMSSQRTQSDDKADDMSFFNELHSPRMMERTLSNSSFGRNHSFGGIRDFAYEVKLSPPPDFWSQIQDSGNQGPHTPYNSALNYSGMSLLSQSGSARSNGGSGNNESQTTINLNRPLDDSHPLFGEVNTSAQSEPPVTPRLSAASDMTLPGLPLYFDSRSTVPSQHTTTSTMNDSSKRGDYSKHNTVTTTPSTSKSTMFTGSAGGMISDSMHLRNNHRSDVNVKREIRNAAALGSFNPAAFPAGMMGPFVSAGAMQSIAPFMATGMPLLPVYQPNNSVSTDFTTMPVPPSLTAAVNATSTPATAVSSSLTKMTPLTGVTDSIKTEKSTALSSLDKSAALATPVGNYAPQKRSKFYKKAPILEREETLRKLQKKVKTLNGKNKDATADILTTSSVSSALSTVLEQPLMKKRTLLSHLKDVKHRKPWTRKNSASDKTSGSKRNASAACETDAKSALRAVVKQQRAEQAAKIKSQSTEPTLLSTAIQRPSAKRRKMNDSSSDKISTIPEIKAESLSVSPAVHPTFPLHLSNPTHGLVKNLGAANSTNPGSVFPFAAQPMPYAGTFPSFPVGMEPGLSFIPAPMMDHNSTGFLSSSAAVPMMIPQRFPNNFNSGGMLSYGLPPVLPPTIPTSSSKTDDQALKTGLPPFIDSLGKVHMTVDAAKLNDVDSAVKTGRQKTKDLKKKQSGRQRKNQSRLRIQKQNPKPTLDNSSDIPPNLMDGNSSSVSESSSVTSATATGVAAAAAGSGERDYYQLTEPEMCWDRRKQFCCLKTHGVRRKEGEGVNKNYGIFVCQVDDESKENKVCGRPFGQKCHWTRHCREKHVANPTRHVCAHCGNSYAQKSSLSHHVFYSHQSLTYECTHCEKTFARKATLESHFAKKHPEFELDTSSISRTSRSPAFARMNNMNHSDDASDTSTECGSE